VPHSHSSQFQCAVKELLFINEFLKLSVTSGSFQWLLEVSSRFLKLSWLLEAFNGFLKFSSRFWKLSWLLEAFNGVWKLSFDTTNKK